MNVFRRFQRGPGRRASARQYLLELAVLALAVGGISMLFLATLDNLERLGVRTGFGFLSTMANFNIVMSLIDYDQTSSYGRAFIVAVLNTVVLAVCAIVLGTVLGFAVGLAQVAGNRLLAKLAKAYVEIVRNLPLLLQLFIWYFVVLRALPAPRESLVFGDVLVNNRGLFLPQPVPTEGWPAIVTACLLALLATGILARVSRHRRDRTGHGLPITALGGVLLLGLPGAVVAVSGLPLSWEMPELRGFNVAGGIKLIPEFVAMVAVLSTYAAASIGELVRGGLQAIDRGQTEAAMALGLRRGQALRLVLVPQALQRIIPPLGNQYLHIVRNSAIGAAIAYPDVVNIFAGTVLNQTGQAVEVIGMTMAVYLAISLVIAGVTGWLNRRVAIPGRTP